MKNIYEKPLADVIVFGEADIITSSASYEIGAEEADKGSAYKSIQEFLS